MGMYIWINWKNMCMCIWGVCIYDCKICNHKQWYEGIATN